MDATPILFFWGGATYNAEYIKTPLDVSYIKG
jgi:hypothetical protein